MMPLDADDEFEVFYDFRRAYTDLNIKRREKLNAIAPEDTFATAERAFDMQEERKILSQQRLASNDTKIDHQQTPEEEQGSDDWEDCDVEDGGTSKIEMVNDTGSPTKHSEVNDAAESNSMSEFTQLTAVMGQKRKGKTRQEAFQELDIEPVEILPSGEIRLPNGKIIGHRDFKHVYRQRLRLPDDRESIVINKLAIEYRRARHGGQLMLTDGSEYKEVKTNHKE